jgi:hypothetical protein
MVETCFKSIKTKLIWRNRWGTRRQAEGAIPVHQWFLKPASAPLIVGGQKPLGFRAKRRINELRDQNVSATGPLLCLAPRFRTSNFGFFRHE